MARYIDADKLSTYFEALAKHAEMEGLYNLERVYKRCLQMIDNAPTADVAPKSEVEELNKQLDELAEEHSDLIVEKDKLFDEVVRLRKTLSEYEETSGLKQAKQKVAREIFEKTDILGTCNPKLYAELKKKYTEDKT